MQKQTVAFWKKNDVLHESINTAQAHEASVNNI